MMVSMTMSFVSTSDQANGDSRRSIYRRSHYATGLDLTFYERQRIERIHSLDLQSELDIH